MWSVDGSGGWVRWGVWLFGNGGVVVGGWCMMGGQGVIGDSVRVVSVIGWWVSWVPRKG